MDIVTKIAGSVTEGDSSRVKGLVGEAISEGITAQRIMDEGLIAGMDIVRKRFEMREIFLPELIFISRAMKAAMDLLAPALASARVRSAAKVVIGTVQGDPHLIGHMLVSIMLKGAGFEVIDLGGDVAPQRFVEVAKDEGVDILGMSCLVTTARPAMIATIEALAAAGLRDSIKVLVGGAIITDNYAHRIGADGYAKDCALAVDMAKELVGITH